MLMEKSSRLKIFFRKMAKNMDASPSLMGVSKEKYSSIQLSGRITVKRFRGLAR